MIVLAEILSFLFNPAVFFFIMPYFIVYRQTGNNISAVKWELFSFAFLFIGLLLVLLGKHKKLISDIDLSNREQRAKFYLILWLLAFSYLFAAIFFRGLFFDLSVISLGIAFGIILFTFVNMYIKASVHVAVACAFVITIAVLYGQNGLLTTIWIIPLVSWARIILKRHTIVEITLGGLLGAAITFLTFLIRRYIILY